ncbi:SemiSWEET transporter [Parapedobacter indicus]|uniref:MtN3 and saliva related transmembrane protein n=1 Tax=Parapedobacter indicus TaxID=1477437 RepID=A0A1I3HPV4_9SPHI|nr:SemiSWEET transporter [Parapedobacter indicus]PPL03124.1 MtN3 and saliva related transmembrane protein [Parapedobacter indicus]SFI37765.1 MtN3 and saliva related transmembrane protein [Parapedobacter indicus]
MELFTYENIIGIAAGICTSIAMLPQLIKVIKTKETADLSVTMIGVLIVGVSLWVYYGFLQNEVPIILSNSFSVVVNLTLLICWFLFRKKS